MQNDIIMKIVREIRYLAQFRNLNVCSAPFYALLLSIDEMELFIIVERCYYTSLFSLTHLAFHIKNIVSRGQLQS
eukprot:snap_masked-scaffold_14-processed-gene-5.15-mRNA-1 protein AED:1.00 eAED:1.00 QI:0/0/0/0/1/1/2/0/74